MKRARRRRKKRDFGEDSYEKIKGKIPWAYFMAGMLSFIIILALLVPIPE